MPPEAASHRPLGEIFGPGRENQHEVARFPLQFCRSAMSSGGPPQPWKTILPLSAGQYPLKRQLPSLPPTTPNEVHSSDASLSCHLPTQVLVLTGSVVGNGEPLAWGMVATRTRDRAMSARVPARQNVAFTSSSRKQCYKISVGSVWTMEAILSSPPYGGKTGRKFGKIERSQEVKCIRNVEPGGPVPGFPGRARGQALVVSLTFASGDESGPVRRESGNPRLRMRANTRRADAGARRPGGPVADTPQAVRGLIQGPVMN